MFTSRQRWLIGISEGVLLLVGCTSGGFLKSGDNSPAANKVLVANLGGPDGGTQASVKFDDGNEHRQLNVEITGGQPGASVDISIHGTIVLSVTLDESGNAHLKFDSNPDEPGETQLATEFPAAGAGDAVAVGELSGNFQEEDDDADADDDDVADADHDDGADVNHDDGADADHDDGADADHDDDADANDDDGADADHDDGDAADSDAAEGENHAGPAGHG